MIHFLTSLTQDKELCSKILDSFFNELDTRQGTMLMTTLYNLPKLPILVSFFNELDTRQGTMLKSSHAPSILMQSEVHAPQASLHSMRWME